MMEKNGIEITTEINYISKQNSISSLSNSAFIFC